MARTTESYLHVFTLEERVTTRDPVTNAPLTSWAVEHQNVPCSYYPQSGREFVVAGAVRNSQTVRFQTPYNPDIDFTTAKRIVFDRQVYPILAVLPDPTAREHVTLVCETGAKVE